MSLRAANGIALPATSAVIPSRKRHRGAMMRKNLKRKGQTLSELMDALALAAPPEIRWVSKMKSQQLACCLLGLTISVTQVCFCQAFDGFICQWVRIKNTSGQP